MRLGALIACLALPGCLLSHLAHDRFLSTEHWSNEIVGCSIGERGDELRVAFVDRHNDEPWRYEYAGKTPAAGAAPKLLRPTRRDRGEPLPPSPSPSEVRCVLQESMETELHPRQQWTPDPRLQGPTRYFDAAGRAEAADRPLLDDDAVAHAALVVRDLQEHGEHAVRLRVFLPPAAGRSGARAFAQDRVVDFALEAPRWRSRVAAFVFVAPWTVLVDFVGFPVEAVIELVWMLIKARSLD